MFGELLTTDDAAPSPERGSHTTMDAEALSDAFVAPFQGANRHRLQMSLTVCMTSLRSCGTTPMRAKTSRFALSILEFVPSEFLEPTFVGAFAIPMGPYRLSIKARQRS